MCVKQKKKKNNGFDGNVILLDLLLEKFRANSDGWYGAIDWEVIIVANMCVYRENVLDEKCYFR